MQRYLSGRGTNAEDFVSDKAESSFSSYLGAANQLNSSSLPPNDAEPAGNIETEEIHADETGIKVEVVTEDGQPRKILVHIPDGRIVELGCEY
jgi:hypothetical protein